MNDMFVVAKSIHLITVTITIVFFLLRGVWMVRQSKLLQTKPVKILPHVNDTVLLLSALWAASMIGQYPFVDAWLTAKLLGVVVYIVLGAIALTYGKTQRQKHVAFVAALLAFGYVVAVAACRNPLACMSG
jgi:uncharacterized membrane protein SirB2